MYFRRIFSVLFYCNTVNFSCHFPHFQRFSKCEILKQDQPKKGETYRDKVRNYVYAISPGNILIMSWSMWYASIVHLSPLSTYHVTGFIQCIFRKTCSCILLLIL